MGKWSLPVLLCTCIVFGVLGCVKYEPGANTSNHAPAPVNAPAPEPQPKPEPEPKPPVNLNTKMREWVKQSPMRMKMHAMWIDTGMIVGFAGGSETIDYDWLEAAAEDIARKADSFADMWEVIRDQNRIMAGQAKVAEWSRAGKASRRLYAGCVDCHVENWSPHTSGFLPETFEGWLKNGNAIERVPATDIQLTAPRRWVMLMFGLERTLAMANMAIDRNDRQESLEYTQLIHKTVTEQIQYWRAIEQNARAIAEQAERDRTDGMREQYNKLIGHCITCHAKYVGDGRSPLDPLPWKAPNE